MQKFIFELLDAWIRNFPSVGLKWGVFMAGKKTVRRVLKAIKRRLRFSLRFLLIVFTLLAVSCGAWIGSTRKQETTIELIHRLGGEVHYRYEMEEDTEGLPVPTSAADPPGPVWLQQQVGIDFLDAVAAVKLRKKSEEPDPWSSPPPGKHEVPGLQVPSSYTHSIPHIFELTHLQRLELANFKVRDEDFTNLEALSKLEVLVLCNIPMSPDRFAHLGRMTQLKKLNVYGTGITDRGLAHLSNLTNLTHLTLYGSQVSNEGLKSLVNMQKLTTLDLRAVRLTDAALETLERSSRISSAL